MELEKFSHEEWVMISPFHFVELVEIFPKRLTAVISIKGVSAKYWLKGMNTFTTSEFSFVRVFCRYS